MREQDEHIPVAERETPNRTVSELSQIITDRDPVKPEEVDHQPNKESPARKLDVDFVYVNHTAQHTEEIVKALEDKDLILFEFMLVADKRPHFEATMNQVLSKDFNGTFEIDLKSESSAYVRRMFEGLQSSGKEVKLIDVDIDEPHYEELNLAVENTEEEAWQVIRSGAPLAEVRNAYESFIIAEGREFKYRDDLLALQLDNIFKSLREAGDDRKIAVLQGGAHTRSYHHFHSDDNINATRQFVGLEASDPRHKMIVPYQDQLIRESSMNPSKKLNPETIDRALLEFYSRNLIGDVYRYTALFDWIQSLSGETVLEILTEVQRLGRKNYPIRSLGKKQSRALLRDTAVKNYLMRMIAE